MKTIEKVLVNFLREQQIQLKPKTYRGYKDTIEFFKDYLNDYAYEELNEEDSELFDKLYNEEDKEFCQIFGPDRISSCQISEFLGEFMIRKVIVSKEFMKTVSRVMRKFIKWIRGEGYMDEEEYDVSARAVDGLKNDLPNVAGLSDLIYEYAEYAPPMNFTKTVEGYFPVTKIQPGKLWLGDYSKQEGKIGPVFVSNEISSLCKVGWSICLKLGKTQKGWQILESGNVYPK